MSIMQLPKVFDLVIIIGEMKITYSKQFVFKDVERK